MSVKGIWEGFGKVFRVAEYSLFGLPFLYILCKPFSGGGAWVSWLTFFTLSMAIFARLGRLKIAEIEFRMFYCSCAYLLFGIFLDLWIGFDEILKGFELFVFLLLIPFLLVCAGVAQMHTSFISGALLTYWILVIVQMPFRGLGAALSKAGFMGAFDFWWLILLGGILVTISMYEEQEARTRPSPVPAKPAPVVAARVETAVAVEEPEHEPPQSEKGTGYVIRIHE